VVNRLYVAFWDLCLDNLPQGRFERRVLGAGDASQMIRAAHTDRSLLCVSKDDLLAPYRTKERRRHEELCAVLRAHSRNSRNVDQIRVTGAFIVLRSWE
jgi:hypothetical protein